MQLQMRHSRHTADRVEVEKKRIEKRTRMLLQLALLLNLISLAWAQSAVPTLIESTDQSVNLVQNAGFEENFGSSAKSPCINNPYCPIVVDGFSAPKSLSDPFPPLFIAPWYPNKGANISVVTACSTTAHSGTRSMNLVGYPLFTINQDIKTALVLNKTYTIEIYFNKYASLNIDGNKCSDRSAVITLQSTSQFKNMENELKVETINSTNPTFVPSAKPGNGGSKSTLTFPFLLSNTETDWKVFRQDFIAQDEFITLTIQSNKVERGCHFAVDDVSLKERQVNVAQVETGGGTAGWVIAVAVVLSLLAVSMMILATVMIIQRRRAIKATNTKNDETSQPHMSGSLTSETSPQSLPRMKSSRPAPATVPADFMSRDDSMRPSATVQTATSLRSNPPPYSSQEGPASISASLREITGPASMTAGIGMTADVSSQEHPIESMSTVSGAAEQPDPSLDRVAVVDTPETPTPAIKKKRSMLLSKKKSSENESRKSKPPTNKLFSWLQNVFTPHVSTDNAYHPKGTYARRHTVQADTVVIPYNDEKDRE